MAVGNGLHIASSSLRTILRSPAGAVEPRARDIAIGTFVTSRRDRIVLCTSTSAARALTSYTAHNFLAFDAATTKRVRATDISACRLGSADYRRQKTS